MKMDALIKKRFTELDTKADDVEKTVGFDRDYGSFVNTAKLREWMTNVLK